MKPSSLRVLLQRQGELSLEGVPKALEGASGQAILDQLKDPKALAAWPLIGKRVSEAVLQLLDVDLVPMLVGAWKKYRVLAEFADPKKHPDDEVNEVALADHTMTLTYQPTIEVTVDGIGRGSLEFTLTVKVEVEAISLTIKAGRIIGVGSGSCSGNVGLSLDKFNLLERKLREVELPKIIDLGNGIPIRVPVSAAADDEQPMAEPALVGETA